MLPAASFDALHERVKISSTLDAEHIYKKHYFLAAPTLPCRGNRALYTKPMCRGCSYTLRAMQSYVLLVMTSKTSEHGFNPGNEANQNSNTVATSVMRFYAAPELFATQTVLAWKHKQASYMSSCAVMRLHTNALTLYGSLRYNTIQHSFQGTHKHRAVNTGA